MNQLTFGPVLNRPWNEDASSSLSQLPVCDRPWHKDTAK